MSAHIGGWVTSDSETGGLDAEALFQIEEKIKADKHQDFHSLLISRHGKLAYEKYFNGYTADTLHDIRSAGKGFTSTLIGIAIDRGDIKDVDAPLLSFFKDREPHQNVDDRKRAITLHHLLTMTSGLDADDMNMASPGCEEHMLLSDDWIRYGLDLPMKTEPGAHFVYAGVNSMLLAGVLQEATQTPFLEFANEHLFEPLNFGPLHWEKSPSGLEAGQGFLSVRGHDMIKLGQMFLDGGKWQGRQIVSKSWVEDATKLQAVLPDQDDAGYGYQWWRIMVKSGESAYSCFFASGNGGNKIYVLPELDLVVAMASSAYMKPYMHERSHEILKHVISAAHYTPMK